MSTYTLEQTKDVWFYSDPHFGHRNIIKYCSRPFSSVEEMNETLLSNYKKLITDKSLVYFLGDMSFGRQAKKEHTPKWWCEQLTGNIITYIKGSHDHGLRPSTVPPKNVQKVLLEDYIEVTGIDWIEDDYLRFRLQHEPIYRPNPAEDDYDWLIHGHTHEADPLIDVIGNSINVSVEQTEYKPISLFRLIDSIREKEERLKAYITVKVELAKE